MTVCPFSGKPSDECAFKPYGRAKPSRGHVEWHINDLVKEGVLEIVVIDGVKYVRVKEEHED